MFSKNLEEMLEGWPQFIVVKCWTEIKENQGVREGELGLCTRTLCSSQLFLVVGKLHKKKVCPVLHKILDHLLLVLTISVWFSAQSIRIPMHSATIG